MTLHFKLKLIPFFLLISNNLNNCFATDGSDSGLQLSVTSNGGLMIELKNECCIIRLPSGVCLFYCYVEN